MASTDGSTRSLVSDIDGVGWDFGITRHPFHEIERPFGPHYCVYNRRLMAVCFDQIDAADGYWRLRQQTAVLHTGEWPVQFAGPDAERLLDLLFTKDITKVRPGRCGYGLACFHDGGLLVDGVLARLDQQTFWYTQADGDFVNWARAHGLDMDVEISDPDVFVTQVQGPTSLDVLAAAADDGLPDPFGYFAFTRVSLGGQEMWISRTGYTNELGWEFYLEPHHDADALWAHLTAAGEPFGLGLFGLDSMDIRRIEAGILNAGSDFDSTTTPYEAGLGRFVDEGKADFIGKDALAAASREARVIGVRGVDAQPLVGGDVLIDGERVGHVTAGQISPYLQTGIGIVRMDAPTPAGTAVQLGCVDGELHAGELAELPLYDEAADIPRGKRVDIPDRR